METKGVRKQREEYLVFAKSKLDAYFTEPLSPRKKRELRLLGKLMKTIEPGAGFLVVRSDTPWFSRVLELIEQEEGHSEEWVPEPPAPGPKTQTSEVSYTVPGEAPQGPEDGDDQ